MTLQKHDADDSERSDLQARLEMATSRELPRGTNLDADTAAMREGWQVLGQLLDAADAKVDLQTISIFETAPPRKAEYVKWGWIVAACVALIFAVVGISWQLSLTESSQTPTRSVAAKTENTQQPSSTTHNDLQAKSRLSPSLPKDLREEVRAPQVAIESTFAWDDSFDSEIANVNQQLISVQAGWQSSSDRWQLMRSHMEEFGQSFDEGSL